MKTTNANAKKGNRTVEIDEKTPTKSADT